MMFVLFFICMASMFLLALYILDIMKTNRLAVPNWIFNVIAVLCGLCLLGLAVSAALVAN